VMLRSFGVFILGSFPGGSGLFGDR
jgi:hypothetical protein